MAVLPTLLRNINVPAAKVFGRALAPNAFPALPRGDLRSFRGNAEGRWLMDAAAPRRVPPDGK